MLKRVEAETAEFEQCTTRLQAMRVGARAHAEGRAGRPVVATACATRSPRCRRRWASAFLNLGARKAFVALCERLRALLAAAQQRNDEIREMLGASFARLNAEFGFSLALGKPPTSSASRASCS